MRELLERRDGPALRDTLLWFGLLIGVRAGGAPALGHVVGDLPFFVYGVALRLDVRLALARGEPRHGVQDRLDEQRALRDRLVHGHPRIGPVALEPRPAPQRHDHRRAATRRSPCRGRPISALILKFFGIPTLFKYFQRRAPALLWPA